MLNMKTRYAMRALGYLASRHGDGPNQIGEIADAQRIPRKFLTVILSELSREGLVGTKRGRAGGYWLERPPRDISYGDIVRITRGSLALVPCAARTAYAPVSYTHLDVYKRQTPGSATPKPRICWPKR